MVANEDSRHTCRLLAALPIQCELVASSGAGFSCIVGARAEQLSPRRDHTHSAGVYREAGSGSSTDAVEEQWVSQHVQAYASQVIAALELGYTLCRIGSPSCSFSL